MWKKAYTTNMVTDTSADESFSTVYGDEGRNNNFMPPVVRTEHVAARKWFYTLKKVIAFVDVLLHHRYTSCNACMLVLQEFSSEGW